MLAMANLEVNPSKKANILSYVSQLHHDMVDFGFQVISGVNGVVLAALEEGKINWLDQDGINVLRKQYMLNALSEKPSDRFNSNNSNHSKGTVCE